MSIQEKEQMYFATEKIKNAKCTLEMIKSCLNNHEGALSYDTLKGAISCVIDTLEEVSEDIIK